MRSSERPRAHISRRHAMGFAAGANWKLNWTILERLYMSMERVRFAQKSSRSFRSIRTSPQKFVHSVKEARNCGSPLWERRVPVPDFGLVNAQGLVDAPIMSAMNG